MDLEKQIQYFVGDSQDILKAFPENSVDAFVLDPPSAIKFMGMQWDSDRGGREKWVQWLSMLLEQALRVIKPGGYMLCWALPKKSHWTACAIEDSGWVIRDRFLHLFAGGFPKSLDISKQLDKRAGVLDQREIQGEYSLPNGQIWNLEAKKRTIGTVYPVTGDRKHQVTVPFSDQALAYDGYGTGLKPAVEDWWLCMKPLQGKTFGENILQYGTGGLNIGASRIQVLGNPNSPGRFPAHVILSHDEGCQYLGQREIQGSGTSRQTHEGYEGESVTGFLRGKSTSENQHASPGGTEQVFEWKCTPECPIGFLDVSVGLRQSGKDCIRTQAWTGYHGNTQIDEGEQISYGDRGYVSRFFYQARITQAERHFGCEGLYWRRDKGSDIGYVQVSQEEYEETPISERAWRNIHPTVKSKELLKYFCRLISPPGQPLVVDPCCGSGSTGIACQELGFRFRGMDLYKEYITIAVKRTLYWRDYVKY